MRCSPRCRTSNTHVSSTGLPHSAHVWSSVASDGRCASTPASQCGPCIAHGTTCSKRQKTASRSPASSVTRKPSSPSTGTPHQLQRSCDTRGAYLCKIHCSLLGTVSPSWRAIPARSLLRSRLHGSPTAGPSTFTNTCSLFADPALLLRSSSSLTHFSRRVSLRPSREIARSRQKSRPAAARPIPTVAPSAAELGAARPRRPGRSPASHRSAAAHAARTLRRHLAPRRHAEQPAAGAHARRSPRGVVGFQSLSAIALACLTRRCRPARHHKHFAEPRNDEEPGRARHPGSSCCVKNRRRPTLPGPCGPSTIGAERLNCSVRNGKRCFPLAKATGNRSRPRLSAGLQNCTACQWYGYQISVKPSTN
jgi:hypothetical protein